MMSKVHLISMMCMLICTTLYAQGTQGYNSTEPLDSHTESTPLQSPKNKTFVDLSVSQLNGAFNTQMTVYAMRASLGYTLTKRWAVRGSMGYDVHQHEVDSVKSSRSSSTLGIGGSFTLHSTSWATSQLNLDAGAGFLGIGYIDYSLSLIGDGIKGSFQPLLKIGMSHYSAESAVRFEKEPNMVHLIYIGVGIRFR